MDNTQLNKDIRNIKNSEQVQTQLLTLQPLRQSLNNQQKLNQSYHNGQHINSTQHISSVYQIKDAGKLMFTEKLLNRLQQQKYFNKKKYLQSYNYEKNNTNSNKYKNQSNSRQNFDSIPIKNGMSALNLENQYFYNDQEKLVKINQDIGMSQEYLFNQQQFNQTQSVNKKFFRIEAPPILTSAHQKRRNRSSIGGSMPNQQQNQVLFHHKRNSSINQTMSIQSDYSTQRDINSSIVRPKSRQAINNLDQNSRPQTQMQAQKVKFSSLEEVQDFEEDLDKVQQQNFQTVVSHKNYSKIKQQQKELLIEQLSQYQSINYETKPIKQRVYDMQSITGLSQDRNQSIKSQQQIYRTVDPQRLYQSLKVKTFQNQSFNGQKKRGLNVDERNQTLLKRKNQQQFNSTFYNDFETKNKGKISFWSRNNDRQNQNYQSIRNNTQDFGKSFNKTNNSFFQTEVKIPQHNSNYNDSLMMMNSQFKSNQDLENSSMYNSLSPTRNLYNNFDSQSFKKQNQKISKLLLQKQFLKQYQSVNHEDKDKSVNLKYFRVSLDEKTMQDLKINSQLVNQSQISDFQGQQQHMSIASNSSHPLRQSYQKHFKVLESKILPAPDVQQKLRSKCIQQIQSFLNPNYVRSQLKSDKEVEVLQSVIPSDKQLQLKVQLYKLKQMEKQFNQQKRKLEKSQVDVNLILDIDKFITQNNTKCSMRF